LTDATNELVNKEFISKMKDGAALINTARGAVINEKDVADALNCGKLSYFGADVLSTEPPKKDNPLLSAENVFLTPHIAWAAYETRLRLLEILNGNIKAFLEGNPINVVNM
jgi:glycerate dehydrogenase